MRNRKAYFEEYNARPGRVAVQATRTKRPEYQRRKQLERQGWTPETFADALIGQDFCCALCGVRKTKLVADHDHTTGKSRAALCHGCNVHLGHYEKTWRGRGAVWEPYDRYISRYA